MVVGPFSDVLELVVGREPLISMQVVLLNFLPGEGEHCHLTLSVPRVLVPALLYVAY